MSETFQEVTKDEYYALGGNEGGGFMGCVFLYNEKSEIIGRRCFDEYDRSKGWKYSRATTIPRRGWAAYKAPNP